jgi:hypothetical protein
MYLLRSSPHQSGLPIGPIVIVLLAITIFYYASSSKTKKRRYYRPRKQQPIKNIININGERVK